MKRSEMVAKLFYKLMMLYNTNLNTMEVSDELLKEMEKEGMLPPAAYYHEQDREIKNAWHEAKKHFYWEPEDERKACEFCENPCGNDHCPVANENKKDN